MQAQIATSPVFMRLSSCPIRANIVWSYGNAGYMMASANKFLRRYYATVKAYLEQSDFV